MKAFPMATGNLNDGLIAFKDGKMITMKVPYPTGFYAKGSMAALTIRTPAGRAEDCGARAATGRRGCWKAARGPI